MNAWSRASFPRLPALILFLLSPLLAARSADLTLKATDKEPPAGLDASIRAMLQARAIQLLNDNKPVYEFWFVKELPLDGKPESVAKALDKVKQATLIGAVNVAGDQRDYRDDELHAGVYTMRFALQPQDGNHLGTSEFSYFVALVAAKLDPKPDGIADYKTLVKASSRDTSSEHPVILSLRPASSDEGELPKLNEPAPDHKSVRLKVPARAAGQATGIVFELVYQGMGKK
jgi:hypothetical protein